MVFTVCLALVSLVISQAWFLLLTGAILVWLVWFVRTRPESTFFLRAMEREHDRKRFPGKGAILLLVGAFLTGLLFPAHIAPALLVLGVADSFSTVVGMRFGKKRIGTSNKTWMGTATFFVCSCAVLAFFSSWWLVVALIATTAEFINYHRFLLLDDNLVIPLVVAASLLVL